MTRRPGSRASPVRAASAVELRRVEVVDAQLGRRAQERDVRVVAGLGRVVRGQLHQPVADPVDGLTGEDGGGRGGG